MILQALYQLYESLAARGLVEEPGWTGSKITYALNLSDDGKILDVITLRINEPRGKKTVQVPQILKTPLPPKRTVGVDPAFLFDNSSYILGIDAKGKPTRTRECFEASKTLHLDLLNGVDTPAARAVKAYFSTWNPDAAAEEPALKDYLDDILTGVNLLFYHARRSVADDRAIQSAWQAHYDGGEGEKIRCLVTGEMAKLARIHPAIKGVRGGQSSGMALVSFNAQAYESFGREQGMNAPIGERAAFAYTTALNHLIADRDHQCAIGDTLVLMWSEDGDPAYQDVARMFMNIDEPTLLTGEIAQQAIVGAMDKLSRGVPVDWEGVNIDPKMRYYILGLSPNAARLSVRFFFESSFGNFIQAAKNHDDRMEIVRPSYDRFERLSLWRMLQETVNQNSRDKKPHEQMTGDVLRAMLTDTRYPATLINQTELRICAERNVTRGRAAIIKAYYLKNKGWPKEVLELNLVKLSQDCEYLPYVLGRLFAVFEMTQIASRRKDNRIIIEKEEDNSAKERKRTIRDHYFNAAASIPKITFETLYRLNNAHLSKLEAREYNYYSKLITNITNMIHTTIPARMSLAERGAFQLGYYHEQQYRYTKKEDREGQKQ